MSRSSPSRSGRVEDEADSIYNIDLPFSIIDSKILLIEEENDKVEVIIGNVPVPSHYDTDRNYPKSLENEEKMRSHSAAKWIVTDAARMLDEYDWKTSHSKTNNPNYSLRDFYFTCDKENVDDAVITGKRFIMELEEKSLAHAREFDENYRSPSEQL